MKAARIAEAWQAEAEKCWRRLLIEIPLYPINVHLTMAEAICRDLCKATSARVSVVFSFALNYREFLAIHFRLARSVQPTGDAIDRLSPIAGAIVTRDPLRWDLATSLLKNEMGRLRDNGDKDGIRKLQDLVKPPLETHRNYQIWIAIDEVLKEWAVTQNQSTQSTTSGPSPDEAPFPTTSDVRRWIDAHPADSRFDTIRNLDEKGWFRLREDSGINVGEKAFHVLLALAGLSVSDVDMTGWDDFHPTSVLKRGGRGKARND